MGRKISAEVKIMNLFATLSDDGRRIVSDWIRSQTATPRRAVAKKGASKKVVLPDNPEDFHKVAA